MQTDEFALSKLAHWIVFILLLLDNYRLSG